MDGLFSHAGSASDTGHQADYRLPERRHSVIVPVPADQAFEGFTDYIHLWWPVGEFSEFGSGSHVTFVRGDLLEESEDGDQHLWGKIVHLDAPQVIVMDFSMGLESLPPTHLSLDFNEQGSGTEVSLIHDGWASGDAGKEQYEEYSHWSEILDYYVRFMGGNDQHDG